MPLYRKAHSRGEFVFDFSWANAYASMASTTTRSC
jgi:predicted N-acyltransferase